MERNLTNAWGEPTALVQNHSIDSRRWRLVTLRAGDVVIASWAKSGTTWLQQVTAHMVYGIGGHHMLPRATPWVESPYLSEERIAAMGVGHQLTGRVFKSHLDARALPYCGSTKYIYVARDGCDVVWSWYQHHRRLRPIVYETMEKYSRGRFASLAPPCEEFRQYFVEWLERDGYPLWPFWPHIKSWWNLRDRSNVLLLHYDDILRTPREQIEKIASFLGFDFHAEEIARLVTVSSKEYMAANIALIAPDLALALDGGGPTFFNGKRLGWREFLSEADMASYRVAANSQLGGALASWLSSRT